VLGAAVWTVIFVTSAIRVGMIWKSFFWQDDYIHIWNSWNTPAGEMIWQNWNGHREPLSFAAQWLLARTAPQVWWPAAVVLSLVAVGTTIAFWLAVRRWRGTTVAPAVAAILFAAWPATLAAQTWLSAGLETVPLLLMLVACWILARPGAWTPVWVGLLAGIAWGFHERAAYFLPFTFVVVWMFSGRRVWDHRRTWLVLLTITLVGLALRVGDGLPGRTGGASIPGSLWYAGPGSVLRSVLGWLPFDGRNIVPVNAGLWAVVVLAIWMVVVLIGLSTQPRTTALVTGAIAAFLVVEVLSFVWLRGGFAGSQLASDPRFTLLTGTVLLVGLSAFEVQWRPLVGVATALAVVGAASIWRMGSVVDPGREWLARSRELPAGAQLAPTPSPPAMLGHFFFTTQPPVYELGTTRTLLQVGPQPRDFPLIAQRPLQIDPDGSVRPLVFTVLAATETRQCGVVRVPPLDAGVRVVRLTLEGPAVIDGVPVNDAALVFPAAGALAPITVRGACVDRVEVGIPGR
jgi:hypothetical protein